MTRYDLSVCRRSMARLNADRHHPVIGVFVQQVRQLIHRYSITPDRVMNMDETGIWFDMAATQTIESVGSAQVPIRRVKASKSRFTAAITITAAGTILPPCVIFWGAHMPAELASIDPNSILVLFQKRAWMDTPCMLQYARSLASRFNTSEPKLLIMDSFICHRSVLVQEQLAAVNFHVIFIPPGFTNICQPLDVAFFSPFKAKLRASFHTWNAGLYDNNLWNAQAPTRMTVCSWILGALSSFATASVVGVFSTCSLHVCVDKRPLGSDSQSVVSVS
jgi:hypothetical protein